MAKAPNTQGNGATTEPGPALPVFYRRPRPLNNELDRNKSLKLAPDFGFARATNSVVLNGGEFPLAMRFYPIVFSQSTPASAVAVLGLVDNENLFVGAGGQWLPDVYVPAYVRRYPFILMEQPGGGDLILCVEEEAGVLIEGGERPLFESGQPTREFHAQHLGTTAFVQALASQGLLMRNEARVVLPSGKQLTLRGFDVVDEAKFNALPDDVFLDWRRRGWLHLVYCHLMSMANWGRLVDLAGKRTQS